MEGEQNGTGMDFGSMILTKPTPSRPQASLPMRSNVEFLYKSNDSPMSLMSSILSDNDPERSFTNLLAGAMSSPTSEDGEGKGGGMDPEGMSMGARSSSSFAERLAARKAVGMSTMDAGREGIPRYKSDSRITMPPSRISMPRPGYQLTIPPGLSPTTLLGGQDSPVLLATSQQAEPSPTTGTFPVPSYFPGEVPKEKMNDQGGSPGFVFKPFPKSMGRNSLSPLAGMGQQSYMQSKMMSQMHSQSSLPSSGPSCNPAVASSLSGQGSIGAVSLPASSMPVAVPLSVPPLQPMSHLRQQSERGMESQQAQSAEQEQQQAPVAVPSFVERPSEDGYNWRKYGQKQVKGSEYPRSYYKCTHANCPMKKKVERSHDGQVTEIVYKGEHNHAKPQPTRRLSVAAAHLMSESSRDSMEKGDGHDGKDIGGFQTGDSFHSMVKNERGDDPSSSHRGNRPALGMSLGAGGTPEPSSPSTSDDEGEDGSKLSTEDGDDDEPDSKRRKKDKKAKELPPAPRTIREPRVVVQTTSDVDILDDGYRWRKYGQKVVKGNPHPRSYYKCTNVGCPVRKHVERASNDPKAVITTYEGKHNHDVPVARNSSHDTAGVGAGGGASGPSQQGAGNLPASNAGQQQQDRYGRRMSVFGRLLEDGSNKGETGSGDVDLGMGVGMGQGMVNMDVSSSNPGGNGDPVSTSITMNLSTSLGGMGMMNEGRRSVLSMDSYGGGMHGQDTGLRPKHEHEDSQSHSNSMQPSLASGNSSMYHHSVAPRLMLGP